MKKLIFCSFIFFMPNLICMQVQKPVTGTTSELMTFIKRANNECVVCGGYCDDFLERQMRMLQENKQLKQKSVNGKKD